MFDLAIIGGGPAALTAALYAARAGLKVKVFEKSGFGGELAQITQISNYPGYEGRGDALAQKMRQQAESAGAEVEYGECAALEKVDNQFELIIDEEKVLARAVLVATGAEPRQLDIALNVPVSYCSLCDIPLVKQKHIAVIGGGNSAVQEAISLAQVAGKVTIITHSTLKAKASLQNQLKSLANIEIIENQEPAADQLNQFDRVFVFIGHRPATSFLPETVLGADGAVVTGANAKKLESSLEVLGLDKLKNLSDHATLIDGLFAAGDVRQGATRQVVTAAGDGAMAAVEINEYLQQKSK